MSLKHASDLQQQIYHFIVNYIKKNQKPPTIREIGHAMGITSTGHIDHHLAALEKKGLLNEKQEKVELSNSQNHR